MIVDVDQSPQDGDIVIVDREGEVMVRFYNVKARTLTANGSEPALSFDEVRAIVPVVTVQKPARGKGWR